MCLQGHGVDGAFNIAETLKSQGLTKLEFVSDEGLTIVNGLVPGLTRPVGLYVQNLYIYICVCTINKHSI